jgi:hypothetical protein
MGGGYIYIRMKKYIIFFGAVIIPLLAGCASSPVAVNPVGPGPIHPGALAPKGYLQVFSDTETHVIGDGPPYYPHTGYSIHDESGKMVQFVPNHIGDMDESPSIVPIPVGNYNVVARSSAYGRVTVPVVIQRGRTTVVHLDRDWRPSASVSTNGLVYLPNGEAVGWRSSAEN